MAASRYADLKLYARLLRQARRYWPHLATSFLLSLLAAPVALLTPLPLKIAVDSLVGEAPPAFLEGVLHGVASRPDAVLALAAGLFVAIALVDQLRRLSSSLLGAYTGEKLILGFRAELFRHAQRLSLSYHDAVGTADAAYRIRYDTGSIHWISLHGVTPFVTAAVTIFGMAFVIAQIDGQLALVALIASPVLLLLTSISRRQLRSGWREAKSLESAAFSVVQEVLTSLRVVKAFGQEQREEDRFVNSSGASVRAKVRMALLEGAFGLSVGLTTAVGSAVVLFVGARHVQEGLLTLGNLVLVMAYLAQLYGPLRSIASSIAALQSHLASAERVFLVLDEEPDVFEKPGARPIERASGAVAFQKVSFAYDGEHPVLRDVSFEIGPGTRIGISGTTGAGKTTLVSLLTRFYDPSDGHILLDGVDLRDYKLADLRNQFAIVLQEPVLFSTSIAENIAYARPEASEQEIVQAARAANAHDFIMALPDGYDTLVGERGMRLSGGERQRISLARAFLKDAPILILDEPTSSVDVKTEAVIMEAMERLMHARTTIMIAHRLSTLANCDARIEIDAGRLSSVAPSLQS